MYLAHFGLLETPFGITPDTLFVFSAAAHQEALNMLMVGVRSGEGFMKVTGEVGTGKTLLCRRFLATLGNRVRAAYVPNPQMEPRALLAQVAEELGAEEAKDAAKLIKSINLRLLQLANEGITPVLCIDEAQTMPRLTLESLRLLSNLETEKRKLIQIILFGQPELDEMLAAPSSRQLLQRIVYSYRLPMLSRTEMTHYLNHRLRIAGYRGEPLFQEPALRSLYQYSGGTPRLINMLAHKSLMACFGEGKRSIERVHVKRAARDTEGAKRPRWWQLEL